MKLQLLSENFKKGVLIAEKIIGKNLTLPILSNILIKTKKGGLEVLATNLEIGVICLLRAKIEKEGEIAVPGQVIGSYLANLPDGVKVNTEAKNQMLYLISEGSQAAIKGVDSRDFPIIPRPQADYLLEVDSQMFQKSVMQVVPSAALTETRQELTGVFFGFEKNRMILAATDSFRLAESSINLEKGDIKEGYQKFISKSQSVIVPAKTLQEVVRSITGESEKVKIYVSESQIFFEVDNILFVSRLIDGKYPEYEQVIPKDFSSGVFVGREELIKAVRTASIFSDAKSREVKLVVKEKEGRLRVESQSVETGENITEVVGELSVKGESVIAFNNRYLLDALSSLSSERVYFGFNDSFGPVIFREVQDKNKLSKNYLHVVMPIRS